MLRPAIAFAAAWTLCFPLLAAAGGSGVVAMLPGIVEAWETVDVAAPVSGVVSGVEVIEMQEVAEGDVLLTLDSRLAEASLNAARAVSDREASLRRAESGVSLAEKYLQRVREAHEKEAASGLELDEAIGRVEEARAGYAQAMEQQREAAAQVALEEERLRGHTLRAPFAGTVMRITARPGAAASSTTTLLRLTNLRRLRVSLYVPVQYFDAMNVGEVYTLHAEAPAPAQISARLLAQEPVIDAATETFRCVFEIENNDLSLPSGFAVRLREPGEDFSSQ